MESSLRDTINSYLFSSRDQNQTTRLQRFSLSLCLYFIAFVIGLVSIALGVLEISWREFWLVVMVAAALQSIVFILLRSGFSKKLVDPSLTLFQILVGMSLLTYILSLALDARGAMLNGYVLAVLFGSFKLNHKEYMAVASFAVAGYALVIVLDLLSPPLGFDLKLELFQLALLSVVVFSCTYIGNHLQEMQQNLKKSRDGLIASHKQITKQRDELESAHRELQGALRQLGQLAVRDDLTGLFNRRQFQKTLESQIKVAQSTGTQVGVLLIDIDHFNQLNESQGREAGDQILRSFSEVARSCLRRTDYIARFGGEEFAVLLPNANGAALSDCAERIRTYIGQINFDSIEEGLKITVSLGGALTKKDESPAVFMERVSGCLTTAKDQGRNRAVLGETD